MHNDAIGVDVLKDHLDAHRLADGASRRFANEKCGRKAFVKRIAETPVERVGFEPTGPYHRAFGRGGRSIRQSQFPSSRRFAEAIGKLATSDRLDATTFSRMGAMLKLKRPKRCLNSRSVTWLPRPW